MGEKGNFKVKAIKDWHGWFTKDKIYEYKDGVAIVDYSKRSGVYDSFEKLMSRNISYKDVLVEYKGEDIMDEKSYFGYEIIKMLAEGKLVAGQVLNERGVNYVVTQGSGHVYLRRQDNNKEVGNSIFVDLDYKFIVNVQKVDFLQAYKEYLDGAEIESCDGYKYRNGKVYENRRFLGETSFDNKELNGKWIVRRIV